MTNEQAWMRAPRQARSQETLERFVDATRALLDERPFEEITVADIVTQAERTVGSFYARFDDKYAVFYELISRVYERINDVVRAFCDPVRWDGHPVADFVEESVRLNVKAYQHQGPLFRASLSACTTDERFRQGRVALMRMCADEQKRFLLIRRDELACDDPARASDQVFELVSARLDHELLFGRFTATSPIDDRALIAELTHQALQVLGARESADLEA